MDHWLRFTGLALDHAAVGEPIESVGRLRLAVPPPPGFALSALDRDSTDADVATLLAHGRPTVLAPDPALATNDLPAARYRRRPAAVLRLASVLAEGGAPAGLTLLPARAARPAVEHWCRRRTADDPAAALWTAHLDDPQYEPVVAIDGRDVVGGIGLQTRGQTTLVADLFVDPDRRLAGLGTALLTRTLALAARGQASDVYAAAAEDDDATLGLLTKVGFERVVAYIAWSPRG